MTSDQAVPELARMLQQLRRREARRRAGAELTYRELAARTGWSLGIIAQYFSGKSLPPVDRFDVLTRLLGASRVEQGTLATARDRVDEHRRRVVATPDCQVRLLGLVEVVGPRGPAALVGTRQRALVGLLALNAGRVVSQTRLVDALWGEDPPRTAITTLYSHVARVRRSLDACGLAGALVTRGPGYSLAVRPDDVDAGRFEARVAQGRQALANGTPEDAAAQLTGALALWRGEPLADAPAVGWAAAEVQRLREVRVAAHEDLWDAQLRLGRHSAVVEEIGRRLADDPTRERSVELLMLALYRCGRHTDAVEAYQRLRGQLADRLGIEPGPRLTQLYAAVLRRSPELEQDPNGTGPAQLPPRAGHFIGRRGELTRLDGLLRGPARVGVVCGPAGMGKTALAVQWAHRVADRYPDGQLFLDLRGHEPATAVPVTEALTHLLRGLDVPPEKIPTTPAAAIGLYRSVLNRRRVLILLDNVGSVDQVTSLAPPSATSLLVVTSRDRLAGLAVDHAVSTVELDALPVDEALTLLRRVLGTDRVAREPGPANELVDVCGGMPLALRIAAAKLATVPTRPIAELAADLSGADRLGSLAVPGDPARSVRTVLASAYQSLSGPAARVFRRMGLHPGESFAAELAVAVSDVDRRYLDELTGVHLIADRGAGRYRYHDLIRLYAAERAEPGDQTRTVARLVDWYLVLADAANRVFDPVRDRAGPVSVRPPIPAPFPADRDRALAFLDGERPNLLPVVRLAAQRGHDQAAWRLAYLLTSYHVLRGYWPDQVEVCRLGLACAQRLDDPAAEALMRGLLGAACNATQRYDEALVHQHRALELMRTAGDRRGEGMALNNIALTHCQLGSLEPAADAFGQALALYTVDDHPPGIALALNNLGHVYLLMGRLDAARDHLRRALALSRQLGSPALEAMTLHSLGEANLAAGHAEAALEDLTAAADLRRRTGERRLEAGTVTLLGRIHRDRGDHALAAKSFRRAAALGRELGDRELESTALDLLRSGGVDRDHRDRVDQVALRDRRYPDQEPQAGRVGPAR
jgi:DNA-binding SARP family transcriptional activator